MKGYSYIVARDYGFAPNPFYGICTLATCKPIIRKHCEVGDYVIGLTPRDREGESAGVFDEGDGGDYL